VSIGNSQLLVGGYSGTRCFISGVGVLYSSGLCLHKCIVYSEQPLIYKPEDGLNKGPKHAARMSYYIIIKIHWSCV
jgi:hypothetical protein